MISLTQSEKTITAQVLEAVFGASLQPGEVFGLELTELETVVVATASGLYSLGKAYFKSLVEQFKAAASAVKQSPKAVFLASGDLTYSFQELWDMAREALEDGDIEGAIALSRNAKEVLEMENEDAASAQTEVQEAC